MLRRAFFLLGVFHFGKGVLKEVANEGFVSGGGGGGSGVVGCVMKNAKHLKY